jgi:hypothetical protein
VDPLDVRRYLHLKYSEADGLNKNGSAGQRWIIAHAGSDKVFVHRIFLIFKPKTKLYMN